MALIKKKKIEIPPEEEFEEFDEEENEEDEEEEETEDEEDYKPTTKPIAKPIPPAKAERKPVVQPQPVQPQYVAVPRVVPIETMINEIYDGQQEIKQILSAILEKLK